MPIVINGSGTVTGISAGGLPDDCITTADIAAGAITDAKVNASAAIADSKLSGTTCKAWVNFNGTGTVAISASGNVSSITDNGTGDYTVNFTTALADGFWAASGIAQLTINSSGRENMFVSLRRENNLSASQARLSTQACDTASATDVELVAVAFFR